MYMMGMTKPLSRVELTKPPSITWAIGLCISLPETSPFTYLTFLQQNGWTVRKSVVLKASFPLTYTECVKSEV